MTSAYTVWGHMQVPKCGCWRASGQAGYIGYIGGPAGVAAAPGPSPNPSPSPTQTYTTELAQLLMNFQETDPSPEVMARVEELCREMITVALRSATSNPLAIKKWVAVRGNPAVQLNETQLRAKWEEIAVSDVHVSWDVIFHGG